MRPGSRCPAAVRSGPSSPPTPSTLWQPRQPRVWNSAFASTSPGAPTRVREMPRWRVEALGDLPEGVAPGAFAGRPVLRQVAVVPVGRKPGAPTRDRSGPSIPPRRRVAACRRGRRAVAGQAVVALDQRGRDPPGRCSEPPGGCGRCRSRRRRSAPAASARASARRRRGRRRSPSPAPGRRGRGAAELGRIVDDVGVGAEQRVAASAASPGAMPT